MNPNHLQNTPLDIGNYRQTFDLEKYLRLAGGMTWGAIHGLSTLTGYHTLIRGNRK